MHQFITQQVFEQHLGAIAGATTSKTLKAAVEPLLAAQGFDRWIYAADNPYAMIGMPAILSSGLGLWLLTYMAKGYQAVDPVVAHCLVAEEPLLWDSLRGWQGLPAKGQSLMQDLAAQGIGSGMAVPLRSKGGPQGLLNVVRSGALADELAHFEAVRPRLVEIGQAMHGSMVRVMKAAAHL